LLSFWLLAPTQIGTHSGRNQRLVCLAFGFYPPQGPKEVRSLVPPKELIFHVDDRILKAIDAAAILYQQAVSHTSLLNNFLLLKIVLVFSSPPSFFISVMLQIVQFKFYLVYIVLCCMFLVRVF
jgi:hypothetical protein